MSRDDGRVDLRRQRDWISTLKPEGLVVSPAALVQAQAVLDHNVVARQEVLKALVGDVGAGAPASVDDLPRLLRELLDWRASDLGGGPGGPALPDDLAVPLPEYGETLRPTYAVPDPAVADGQPGRWLMLIQVVARTLDLDALPPEGGPRRWHATPQARFERLLRDTRVPIGLVTNGLALRLVYAPRLESPGHLTFPLDFLLSVDGRPALAGLVMLLHARALFSGPRETRLKHLLDESRKYQNTVSTRLAEQVLQALHELLRGFQAADALARGRLLKGALEHDPQSVYAGLLGTLLRLVFVLYAEDRKLLPQESVFQRHYSLVGLHARLRDDAARHPDTLDQRHGAWAQVLTLFRLIYDGAAHGELRLPARHGDLFDPDRWDFLEGRAWEDRLDRRRRLDPPRVADGVVYRVLDKLLLLDGERISYSALDVEQIGSVYEAMMGFELRRAEGTSVTLSPQHVVVDLDALLALPGKQRLERLKAEAGCDLAGKAAEALKAARTVDDALGALDRRLSPLNPGRIPRGGLFLQPTEERRRSGSHYTPRALTAPIVEKALGPVLRALGDAPRPEQVLGLKVCDPAMGSGAFLVEACRALGRHLAAAWERHGGAPPLPTGEDAELHAQRLVAERCLYGVDKNPLAVDLAKLSLWLATLARHQPFTFLDHALRCGDSLVGLGREQVACFDWRREGERRQLPLVRDSLAKQIAEAEKLRARLHALGDAGDPDEKARLHAEAMEALRAVRLGADAAVAAFFERDKDKDRERRRTELADEFEAVLQGARQASNLERGVERLAQGARGVRPFHWELEFPEVFSRERPGFDCVVGNPPFLGGTRISTVMGMPYFAYMTQSYPPAGHLCDLVAYFFRRSFDLLRTGGTQGLIATNTIAQGDTREGALTPILANSGVIYSAARRLPWPGSAAVVVSLVHLVKRGAAILPAPVLDGRPVRRISAYLVAGDSDASPTRLGANSALFSAGSKIYGQGFIFDDSDPEASSTQEMDDVLRSNPRSRSRILPYLGGEEVNNHPTHAARRHVIFLSDLLREEELSEWAALADIVRRKVKPERDRLGSNPNNVPLKRRWWAYQAHRPELYRAIASLSRVAVISQVTSHFVFALVDSRQIFAHTLNVFSVDKHAFAGVLQSRIHETWARFFGSSMKDDLRYTPSDCFETFPFPSGWETDARLEAVGRAYYDFRAALMVRNDEGLTRTYNRFHDPDERDADILRLRELHDDLDRAVLDAYGWTDLRPRCEFLLDYEDDDEAGDEARPTRRKKPWRYRWPDDVRDEVLARLLALNAERAAEEARAGSTAAPKAKPKPKKRTGPVDKSPKLYDG